MFIGSAVKEVLRQTIELEKAAETLLHIEPGSPGAQFRIKEYEAWAEKGSALCIQLPCLPNVFNRLQQVSFCMFFLNRLLLMCCLHRKNIWKK
jgi:hypothetical protein